MLGLECITVYGFGFVTNGKKLKQTTKGVNREGPLRALNNHVFEHLNPKP